MKRTIQVNLGGQIFTLDDDAYEALSNYLKRISRLYDKSAGKDEILSDIETRIAELFNERTSAVKQVISIADVKAVITIMGNPEEFEGEVDADTPQGAETGGRAKRLFRDTESEIIGGVCGGIGHYFGIDPLWVRLAFVVALVFFGTGVLFYILLWIVIPEAKTTTDKLHMKGEPVNIGNIGKTIEREIEAVGEKVSRAGDKFSKGSGKKIENGIERVVFFLVELMRRIFNAVGKIIGGLFVFVGLVASVAILAGVLGLADLIHFDTYDWDMRMDVYEWGDIVFSSGEWMFAAILAFILLIGIPFVGMVYGGLVLLFPAAKVPYLGASLGGMWFIGFLLAIVTAFGTAREFSKEETRFELASLAAMGLKSDTVFLETGVDPFNISTRRSYRANDDFMMKIENRRIVVGNVRFNILQSKDDQFWLEIKRTARAGNYETADQRADSIFYNFYVDSSKLTLNPYFSYPQIQMLRGQEVNLTLRMPLGKTVFMEENLKRIIYDIDNVSHTFDPYMVEHYWRMTEDGLTCLDCNTRRESEVEMQAEPDSVVVQ